MTDADIKEELCRRLIEGESLRAICRSEGMPRKSTICKWLNADDEFARLYAFARQMQGEAYGEEIIEIADTPVTGVKVTKKADGTTDVIEGDMIEHRRLQVDARKWVASKLYPKKYGDSTMLKHADADGQTIPAMTDVERAARLASLFAAVQHKMNDGELE